MPESNTPTPTPRKQGAKRKRSSASGASTAASSSSRKKKGGGAKPSAADSLTNNNNNNNNRVAAAAAALPTPPPSKTLIIDNGGDTIKYGWSTDDNDEQRQQPRKMPNVSARLIHQFTVLVGDEMDQVTNPNSLIGITRSTERGIITNLGNQTQVWKRILDIMGVTIPLHTEAATCFGWKAGGGAGAAKGGRKKAAAAAAADPTTNKSNNKVADNAIPAHSIAVLLLFPPFYPRLLLDQIMYVWMEDFGVSHVGIGLSTALASKEHPTWKTALTVDMGWSACHVVPTFKKKPIGPNKNNNNNNNITAIRRLPIGGRHMINILKYHMSYRQYNLMDQDHLLRDVLEQQAFLSLDLLKDLRLARQLPSGRRPYDRDYILPDYQQTHKGTFRLTPQLQKELELKSKKLTKEEEEDDEEEDEDFEEGDAEEDSGDDESGDDDYDGNNNKRGSDDEDGDDDEEEETNEQKRARLMRERAEAERRRREQEEEQQVLRISVERFTVPEVLFRPKDSELQADLVGLAEAIVQSIMATPVFYHAALFQNICVTGGLSKLPNLKIRLERELRPLTPSEYTLKIEMLEDPIDRAWHGGKDWVQNSPFAQWSIGKDEWEASAKRKAYSRLLLSGGGSYT